MGLKKRIQSFLVVMLVAVTVFAADGNKKTPTCVDALVAAIDKLIAQAPNPCELCSARFSGDRTLRLNDGRTIAFSREQASALKSCQRCWSDFNYLLQYEAQLAQVETELAADEEMAGCLACVRLALKRFNRDVMRKQLAQDKRDWPHLRVDISG